MKIAVYNLADFPIGKHNVRDSRLDELDKFIKAKKKTYLQVEIVGPDNLLEADAILVSPESRTDLILKDLEFIETRLGRSENPQEKELLAKLKSILEKEIFVFQARLNSQEQQAISGYSLLTNRPVVVADAKDLENKDALLLRALKESGYICFFTGGERESRAWLIKQGTTAWEAAGEIHSDIQKGFIRAEIISFTDFIQLGGETKAKQAGKLRLEQKDYLMQDGDFTTFRFNR